MLFWTPLTLFGDRISKIDDHLRWVPAIEVDQQKVSVVVGKRLCAIVEYTKITMIIENGNQ